MTKKKVVLFWSGGKDSALAYKKIKEDPALELVSLLSTIDQDSGEIKYHGVPEVLIKAQADMMNVPVIRVYLPSPCSNADYEKCLEKYFKLFKAKNIDTIAFGDIHLQEIRDYRESLLKQYDLNAYFPLWGKSHEELLNEFINSGHRAVVTAIDEEKIDLSFLAKEISLPLIEKLDESVDPMGENGEYHSFVNFGPYFKMRVQFSKNVTISDGPYTICKLREA